MTIVGYPALARATMCVHRKERKHQSQYSVLYLLYCI